MNFACETKDYPECLKEAAGILENSDDVLILFHAAPDGDAIGSAYALCRALQLKGKSARTECSDSVPAKYDYLISDSRQDDFVPKCIVAVDVAATNLFGEKLASYAQKINLCIDHHISNAFYASRTLLNDSAAATCEIIPDLIDILGVKIDKYIANCIYTGLATDTGCFRFSNTTPKTLRCAADMIESGADSAKINKVLFETSSRQRMDIEKSAMSTLEYFYHNQAAMLYITKEMCEKSGVSEADLEGIPSLPVKIEGVKAGITIKEKKPGVYKISVRTNDGLNASDICSRLGGGGHAAAAGCQIEGSLENARNKMIELVGKALNNWDERNNMH